MKHLLKKINLIVGGGRKKPKVEPATLEPPQIGNFNIGSSYSYVEVLDLISDGPIAGVVDQNGLVLPSERIFEGIYLDNTPVAVTSSSSNVASKETIASDESILKDFVQFFKNLKELDDQLGDNRQPIGFKAINKVNFTLETVEGSKADIDPTDYVNDYIQGTNLSLQVEVQGEGETEISKQSKQTLTSQTDFVNFFDLSLNLTAEYEYSRNQQTEEYFTDFLLPKIKNPIDELIALYNAEPNDSERFYIDKLFSRNFGENWEDTEPDSLVQNWALRFGANKMVYVINTDGAVFDFIGKTFDSQNTYQFELQDSEQTSLSRDRSIQVYDFILPRVDDNKSFTGVVKGCIVIVIGSQTDFFEEEDSPNELSYDINYSIGKSSIDSLISSLKLSFVSGGADSDSVSLEKYNFTNMLSEYRSGEEFQARLEYFRTVLIDKNYSADLIGPFRSNGEVQRIVENESLLERDSAQLNFGERGFPFGEGSNDSDGRRSQRNYTSWNHAQSRFDEVAIPIVHTIENPNVTHVFISIQIQSLSDTLSKSFDKNVRYAREGKLEAGSNFASIVNIEVETGFISEDGIESQKTKDRFSILSLILSPTIIDIGNPDSASFTADYPFLQKAVSGGAFEPFSLPLQNDFSGTALSSNFKRYVKVTKISTETNSSLISKEIKLAKVTEIIPLNFTYPHSAIVASKIDSRSFGSVPTRTFDCKLKKVKVPSNYYPTLVNGRDKRYYSKASQLDQATDDERKVYDGDWDGTLSDDLQWTDNPAWILYDLITNKRYGLGQYIDEREVDIFDLYKIGRFCDAVDDDGFFEGVPDNAGGLEPRFSCNIMFTDGIKVFDALNTISALFRGLIYYSNSQINFVDDRPKEPIALFTNTNVKDGIFNYSNYKRDEQFNTLEVVYIDRFDNFLTKIEYVEDEDDVRKRGVFKKTINANGVTSRAMARRLGKHLIFQTIKENQNVSFSAGMESLLCRPGDLIIIEDELKSLRSNFGKVLSVDADAGSIRLSEKFISGLFDNRITVYTPSGQPSIGPNAPLSTVPQITTFGIDKITQYEYGCEVFIPSLDINRDLVSFVSEGSVYRFQKRLADDEVYKVISIQEENQNEYSLSCTKFDAAKYSLIEGDNSIVNASATYSYSLNQKIGDVTYQTLSAPDLELTTGSNASGFYISGNWSAVNDADGYNVNLYQPNGVVKRVELDGIDNTGLEFFVLGIGNYSYRVSAYGNYKKRSTDSILFYDSDYSSSGLFLVYNEAVTNYDRVFLSSVKIS
jgi:hypothetical protein